MTLQGEEREETVIEGGGYGNVVHITADGVTCSGFTLRNGEYGLNLISDQPVHHITLKHLIVTSNLKDGILCRKTEGYNAIEDCVLSNNGGMGLFAHQFSESAIRNCEVFGNSTGILLGWSWYSVIQDNVIYRNGGGIYLDSCYYTTTKNNLIHANPVGISLGYIASRNTIKENIVLNNESSGLSLPLLWAGIGENRLYHNDLANPKQMVLQDARSDSQFWDNGYPSGGNFWSDYNGQDANRDGIGDTPYMLTDKSGDAFPLIQPWNKIPADVAIGPGGRGLEEGRNRIEVFVRLPVGIPIEAIDVSSLQLNGKSFRDHNRITVGDGDHDGSQELKLTVNGEDFGAVSPAGNGGALAVSGKLKNGLAFEGSCSIALLEKNRSEGRNIRGDRQ
jgi:parallel beta-helix repeat protein